MSFLESILLGLLQGLTEFLPVSSSGHLVLGQAILGIDKQSIAFEVFVHFGTLLAVVTVFWKDVYNLLITFLKLFKMPFCKQEQRVNYRSNLYFKLMILILIGSIPAAIAGLLFEDTIERAFSNPQLVSAMLILTGFILLATRFIRNSEKILNGPRSIAVGLAQALAIIPGISRSGATISTGLYLNVNREQAAYFSFLLAIPVIIGATILKTLELIASSPPNKEIVTLIAGTLTAYISGYLAIKVLLTIVKRGKLDRFAYYCFAVGILGLILY